MQGSQKKWPSRSQETEANSIAERNQHKLLVNVGSGSSNKTQLRLISWTPLIGRQQIPRCSSLAYWRFEPESNMSLLSRLGRITPCLILWWPRSGRVRVWATRERARESARKRERERGLRTLWRATPGSCPCAPSSSCGREVSDKRRTDLRRSVLPARSASLCAAQPRSVRPLIINSLGYETGRRERGRDGNAERRRDPTAQTSVSLSSRK